MYYYEVLVAQEYISRASVFTYASEASLERLSYCVVPLQRKSAVGLVIRAVPKPTFDTKSIQSSLPFGLPPHLRKLMSWLQQYYAVTESQALTLFLPPRQMTLLPSEELAAGHLPAAHALPTFVRPPEPLTTEQTAALQTLRAHPKQTVLLHGDTGSGKTRLYIERALDCLQNGQSVLLLCPEIALTPQLFQRLQAAAPGLVQLFHSQLNKKQRDCTWQLAAQGHTGVYIGTRSALFLPITNLGLIIIDEAHETAYKQAEGVRYHATRVASTLMRLHGAQLIVGSGTPLVADRYLAEARGLPIIRMSSSALPSLPAQTTLIDMRNKQLFSKHPLLSDTLLQAVGATLQSGKQSLIYLNRRGTARAIICQACGWQALCPICDIPLTYHHDAHRLRCHTCGHTQAVPALCPVCKAADILFKSAGTKALELFLQKQFPTARVARFDTDNSKAESFAQRHDEVHGGRLDILVGTQLLVKGHDLRNLALVGIVAADLSLQIPDFTAEERTYQLLAQAMGRVGRGHTAGQIIVQTFNPDHPTIQQALHKDYDGFYTTQIEQRRAFAFPPICQLALFWISKKSPDLALRQARALVQHLRTTSPTSQFLGPTLSFAPKKRGYATAQIVVKNSRMAELSNLAANLPSGWQHDIEPVNLL